MSVRLALSAFLVAVFVAGCTSLEPSTKVDREPSSLDNNADDSFDADLEAYYGGSRDEEAKANAAVAEVIRHAVEAQYKVRAEADPHAASTQRVFNDLPKAPYATRDVHRKTNGCFTAELQVTQDLRTRLNQNLEGPSRIASESDLGIFAGGSRYDAVVRLSNGHPGNRPDRLADARGFAVKLLPVNTLSNSNVAAMDASTLNQKTSLDILSINFPTFFMNDPVRYANLNKVALTSALDFKNKLQAKTEEFWSVFVSGELSALERRLALYVNGSVIDSPLYQEYFSMVPSRLGPKGSPRAVKYSWVPTACSPDARGRFNEEASKQWKPWTKDHSYAFPPRSPLQTLKRPDDYLRLRAQERLAQNDFCFDLYFQLNRDRESTRIEDSTDIWLRSEQERKWWLNEVVPNALIWKTSSHNTESHSDYVKRIEAKKISAPVLAARLKINRLTDSSPVGNTKTCEDLSFNPWNGNIAYHKPLGIVSRMKRRVYNASRRERHELNGVDDRGVERR